MDNGVFDPFPFPQHETEPLSLSAEEVNNVVGLLKDIRQTITFERLSC